MSVDKNGRELSEPIPPLDLHEWENIQIDGEIAVMGGTVGGRTAEKQIRELGEGILKMSSEIFRLRLTYGEEVWTSVYHTKEEDEEIRRAHEGTKK